MSTSSRWAVEGLATRAADPRAWNASRREKVCEKTSRHGDAFADPLVAQSRF